MTPWDRRAGYGSGRGVMSPLALHKHQEGLQHAEAGGKMLGQRTHVEAQENPQTRRSSADSPLDPSPADWGLGVSRDDF